LVGLRRALAMMLEGGNVYAKPALRMGLVDALHHEEGLLGAALAAAHGLADGVTRRRPRRKPLEAALERGPASALVYRRAERLVRRRTRGNYPAPARIIDAVRTGLERGVPAGLEAEARHFTELLATPEARAL